MADHTRLELHKAVSPTAGSSDRFGHTPAVRTLEQYEPSSAPQLASETDVVPSHLQFRRRRAALKVFACVRIVISGLYYGGWAVCILGGSLAAVGSYHGSVMLLGGAACGTVATAPVLLMRRLRSRWDSDHGARAAGRP